ncbi:MAG: hypothetical protein KDB00_09830 [Planctomycetales bacterium]|nr:hypothetical protein [Planctomycetales bacterium]
MNLIGVDFLERTLETDGFYFKVILNESGAYFFPYTTEHRDATQPGLCYKDDSMGNALAATINPGRIDVRFHRSFSDARVSSIVDQLFGHPDGRLLSDFTVTYQGRTIRNS